VVVPLLLQARLVGDVTVIACSGRIVEGDESAALDSYIKRLLPLQPHIVLDIGGVSFVDSAGLGLLVRLQTRARAASGDLKLCAVADPIRRVLSVTKLDTVLPAYESDVEAITAFYSPAGSTETAPSLDVDILCVHPSPDVLAYLRELLRRAEYGVATTTNLSDARTLLRATRAGVVVIAAELHAAAMAESQDSVRARATRVVQLPAGFSTDDAGDAAARLLADIGGAVLD
jgi:anti-sigma B factor antagonist